jgi:hypothetical protein
MAGSLAKAVNAKFLFDISLVIDYLILDLLII